MIPRKEHITDEAHIRPLVVEAVQEYFDRLKSLTRLERKQGSIPDKMAIDMIWSDLATFNQTVVITRDMVETVFFEVKGKK